MSKHCVRGKLFIFSNGPSLNKEFDLFNENLSKQTILVVNNYALHPSFSVIKPEFYLFADPVYWDLSINRMEMVSIRENIFDIICHKTNWKMTIFVPNRANITFLNSYLEKNSNVTVTFYNTSIFKFLQKDIFLYNSLKFNLTATTQNVLAAAIYISINIGFKEIELYGADNSWLKDLRVNTNNDVCLIDEHFYDSSGKKTLVKWQKPDGTIFTMREILKTLSNLFFQYESLNYYALKNNVKIVNCTQNSYIDAFDKLQKNE